MAPLRRARREWLEPSGVTAACLFCRRGLATDPGAYWMTGAEPVAVCCDCVRDGKLGLLVGDAVVDELEHQRHAIHEVLANALVATEREAWRAATVQLGRRREEPR
jgi:hypothetical protein